MKIFYLDTSAINRLYDDPNLEELKATIKNKAQVYISVFTVAELASTSDKYRRTGLLKIAKDITGNYRPAAMPGELLKRSLEAINDFAPDMDNSMGTEWDGLWIGLNDPTLIDEESYHEIIEWKAQQEAWYHQIHERGRPLMQETIKKLPLEERATLMSSFAKLIRYYRPDRDFLNDFVANMAYRSGTEIHITRVLTERIIKHSEHWRFFLAGMAYSMYGRAIRSSSFGRDKNPGSIDTQQSIYLTLCDVFVTADRQQYRMLRSITPFGHRKRKIWTYPKFRSWLLGEESL